VGQRGLSDDRDWCRTWSNFRDKTMASHIGSK
jgi:hypothetical protein